MTFCRETLGIEPWSRQEDLLRAVAAYARVAARSGHKTGKSASAAAIALWWVSDPEARPGARVVMTSSSYRQVKGILWKELRRLWKRAAKRGKPLGGALYKLPDSGLQFEDGREIVGFSTNEPEKMAGYSGEHLLFILDEASGIPEEIFEAVEGNRAGGAKLLMLSNPTQMAGTFYEAFTTQAHLYESGALLHISSEETPNASGQGKFIPGLASKEWVAEKRLQWGEDDPRFQVRVKGNFPKQAANAVIGLKVVETAEARWVASDDKTDDLELGVDPARFGDDSTAVCARRGARVLGLWVLPKADGPDTAGEVLLLVRDLRRDREEIPVVKVDPIGIGASVFDALARAEEEVEAVEVSAAEAPRDTESYAKLRDELWFGAAEWLKAGGAIPADPLLRGELVAPTYRFDALGRQKVEPKEVTKEKLKRSPDRADAFCLAVYNVRSRRSGTARARSRWSR